jgi:tetratricopeptide (TPR) repeat protein
VSQPEGIALVFVALAGLFVTTGSFAGIYRRERLHRAETHYGNGEQLARAGRAAAAAEEYRAALTFSPNDGRYRLALARSLMRLGRLDEAESHLIGLHDNDPDNALVELLLARIAAKEGRVEQAVAEYHQALYGLWPEEPAKNRMQAGFELVELLARTGQARQAAAELMVLADEAPDDAAAQERIGRLLLSYGSPLQATEIFTHVAQRNPRNAAAADGAGDALFAQGNYAAAEIWFRRAQRLDPANAEARERLAECGEILALDPTLVRLSAPQRYARSRALVEKTQQSLQTCSANRTVSADTQALIASATDFLKVRRKREGDTPAGIELAERIWSARKQTCGQPPAEEEPLDLTLAKVNR